jgi:hypothetical protein
LPQPQHHALHAFLAPFAVPEVAEAFGRHAFQQAEIATPEALLVESARLLPVLSGDAFPKLVQRPLVRPAHQQESQRREEGGLGQADPAARPAQQQEGGPGEVETLAGEDLVGENERLPASPETQQH